MIRTQVHTPYMTIIFIFLFYTLHTNIMISRFWITLYLFSHKLGLYSLMVTTICLDNDKIKDFFLIHKFDAHIQKRKQKVILFYVGSCNMRLFYLVLKFEDWQFFIFLLIFYFDWYLFSLLKWKIYAEGWYIFKLPWMKKVYFWIKYCWLIFFHSWHKWLKWRLIRLKFFVLRTNYVRVWINWFYP